MYRSSFLDFERLWGKKTVEESVETENKVEAAPVVEDEVHDGESETSYEKRIDRLIDEELAKMKSEDIDVSEVKLNEVDSEPASTVKVEEPEPTPVLVAVSKPSFFKRIFSCGSSSDVK